MTDSPHRLGRALLLLTLAASGVQLSGIGLASAACDQTLNPGDDIGSAISGAAGGAVICLADGDYDGIRLGGVSKSSTVTVQSMGGAANVNVGDLDLDDVSHVHLSGVTFTGGTLRGHHLHITDSIGAAHILNGVSQILGVYGTIPNADILIDRVRYSDIPNPCTDNACVEGRISVLGGGNPSGITISRSYFSGGNSDGIQVGGGAGEVQIIGNEFTGIYAADGTHTDSIQLYGQGPGTVIKGNYFHDTGNGIASWDGGSGEQILDNVFDLTGYPYGVVLVDSPDGLIRHNTFVYGTSCPWDSCGTLWVQGSVTLDIRDNVIGQLKIDSGAFTEDYNLIGSGGSAHGNTIVGLPTYTGGASPTTYADFQLTSASPGYGAASDGLDMGIRLGAVGAPPAAPGGLQVR